MHFIDNKARFLFLFLLAFLLFLNGCIFRVEKNLQENMPLSSISSSDIDENGVPDIYNIYYTETKTNAGNSTLFINRKIYLYPDVIEVNPKSILIDENETAKLKNEIIAINENLIKEDVSCKSLFEPLLCNDEKSCENSCLSKACKEQKYGLMLYDYSNLLRQRDEQLRALLLLSQALKPGDTSKDISSRITTLQFILKEMEEHPLIKDAKFCSFSYELGNLTKYVGTANVVRHKAFVITSITGSNIGTNTIEVSMRETIDPRIDSNIKDYVLSTAIRRAGTNPIRLDYSDIRFTNDAKIYILYYAIGALSRDIIQYEIWNDVKAEVRLVFIDISNIEGLVNNLNTIYMPAFQATNMTKLSLGIIIWIFAFILIIILELAAYILRLISLIRQRKPIIYSLRRAFGFASLTWTTDMAIGSILLIASYVLDIYIMSPISMQKLSLNSLITLVTQDPLIIINTAGYAAGLLFLSLSFIDRIKRLLSGKEYDEAVEAPTQNKNLKLWQTLSDNIEKTKKALDKAAEMEMDVGQQMSQLLSIPIDAIKKEIYSNPNQKEVRDKIVGYINAVNSISASVSQKVELAKQKRREWLDYINEKIEKVDQLPLDALVAIPIEWRFWAAKEYIKEHPEKFSSIEGVMLVKRKLTEEQKADIYIEHLYKDKKDKVSAIIVLKDKNIIASYIKQEKKSLMKNLAALIKEEIDFIGTEALNAEGLSNSMVIKKVGDKTILIIAKKEVIEELSKNAEQAKNMLA
ncbi:MAG: hypothetical protein QXP22_01280 [Candidatus Anstonellales archaeon]